MSLLSEKYRLLHKATSRGYNIIYCIINKRNFKGKSIKPGGFISVAVREWKILLECQARQLSEQLKHLMHFQRQCIVFSLYNVHVQTQRTVKTRRKGTQLTISST